MLHATSTYGRRLKTRTRQGVRAHAREQSELSWLTPAGRRRRKTNRRRKVTIIERLFRWIKVPTGKVRRKSRPR